MFADCQTLETMYPPIVLPLLGMIFMIFHHQSD